jgi:hypothetical protein
MNTICQTSDAGKVHMYKTMGKVHIFWQTQNLQESKNATIKIAYKVKNTKQIIWNPINLKDKCSNGEIYKLKCFSCKKKHTHTADTQNM